MSQTAERNSGRGTGLLKERRTAPAAWHNWTNRAIYRDAVRFITPSVSVGFIRKQLLFFALTVLNTWVCFAKHAAGMSSAQNFNNPVIQNKKILVSKLKTAGRRIRGSRMETSYCFQVSGTETTAVLLQHQPHWTVQPIPP